MTRLSRRCPVCLRWAGRSSYVRARSRRCCSDMTRPTRFRHYQHARAGVMVAHSTLSMQCQSSCLSLPVDSTSVFQVFLHHLPAAVDATFHGLPGR